MSDGSIAFCVALICLTILICTAMVVGQRGRR